MRNRKIILSTFTVALIIAIVLSLTLVFALPNNAFTGGSSSQEQSETSVFTMPGSQANDISFMVVANGTYDINKDVVVTDSKGDKVPVGIEELAGKKFNILAPKEGYQAGRTYTIKVFGNVTFAQYMTYTVIHFTIFAENSEDVAIKENVVEIPYTDVEVREDTYLRIKASSKNAGEIGYGSIIIAYAENDIDNIRDFDPAIIEKACSVAYKVEGYRIAGSSLEIYATRPTVEEVYDRINVNIDKQASEEDINLNSETYQDEMLKSSLVQGLAYAGLGAPEVKAPEFKFEDGKFIFDVSVTFTGKFGTIVISFRNELAIGLVANIDKDFTKNFKIGVDVKNVTTAGIYLNANLSGSEIMNVQDIFKAVQDRTGTESKMAKIFTWNVPIGAGFNIGYDLDFVFRYNLTGDLSAKVVTTLSWDAGIMVADGKLTPYSYVYANLDYAGITMRAVINLKAGIINYININILSIIGAGFEIEVGGYSDIYGAAAIVYQNGAANENDGFSAGCGFYSDNGIYYDIRLKAHIGISNILDTDIALDIYSGKTSLFEVGEKEFMFGIKNISNATDPVNPKDTYLVLTSKNSRMPAFEVDMWNFVSNTHRYVAIDLADVNFVFEQDTNINIDKTTGRITLLDESKPVDEYVKAEIKNVTEGTASYVSTRIHVVLRGGNPILENDEYSFTSSTPSDINIPFILNQSNLVDNTFVGITGCDITPNDYTIDVDYTLDGSNPRKITIDKEFLRTLPTGNHVFKIETIVNGGTLSIPLYVEVENNLAAISVGTGSEYDPYELYNANQVLDMAQRIINGELNGKYFVLGNDINMFGADLAIPQFNGVLDGKGFTIKNFVVTKSVDNAIGFVAVNNGTIKNITVDGTISGTFGTDAYLGMIAGRNNGTITNVVAKGTVKNHTGLLILAATINMGGIVGENNGSITDSTAQTSFAGASQLDIGWLKHIVGGVTAKNNATVVNAFHTANDLQKSVKLTSDQGPSLFIRIGLKVNAIY